MKLKRNLRDLSLGKDLTGNIKIIRYMGVFMLSHCENNMIIAYEIPNDICSPFLDTIPLKIASS